MAARGPRLLLPLRLLLLLPLLLVAVTSRRAEGLSSTGSPDSPCADPPPGCCPGFVALPAPAAREDGGEGRSGPLRFDSAACVAVGGLDLHDHALPAGVRSAILVERKEKRRRRREERRSAAAATPPRPPAPPPSPPTPPAPPAAAPRPATPVQDWWGKIDGSPTQGDFQMSDKRLSRKCADKTAPVPVRDLPLSLTPDDFRRLFLTKIDWTGGAYGGWSAKRWKPHWEKLSRYLPQQLDDVIDVEKPYPNCAVVGNSGNLLSTQYGEYIDAHHTVFRINKGPIKGFEKHIGSKTNFRFMNKRQFSVVAQGGQSHHHREKLPKDFNVTYLVSRTPPDLMLKYIPLAMRQGCHKNKALNFVPVTLRIFKYANRLLSSYMECIDKRGAQPGTFTSSTSGLMTVLLAMQLCDKVAVFGIGEPPIRRSTPYQYFHGHTGFHPRTTMNDHHNLTAEGALIDALAEADLVTHCKSGMGEKSCIGHGLGHWDTSDYHPSQDTALQAAHRAVGELHQVENQEERPTDIRQGTELRRKLRNYN